MLFYFKTVQLTVISNFLIILITKNILHTVSRIIQGKAAIMPFSRKGYEE